LPHRLKSFQQTISLIDIKEIFTTMMTLIKLEKIFISTRAVSAFIIICSAHVHWFLRPLNAMRYADAYKPQIYIIGDPGFPRPVE